MKDDLANGSATLIGRVPFVLVLSGFVVKGAVFLLLNAGVLLAVARGQQFPDLASLCLNGVIVLPCG
jgi:hypothetical protein